MFEYIKLALYGVVLGAVVGGTAWVTHRVDTSKYEALELSYQTAMAQAESAALAEQKRQDQLATDAATQEIAHQATLTAAVQRQLSEVKKHANVQMVSAKCVPYGFVRLLDAAVFGSDAASLPLPTGRTDASCAPFTWDALARAVLANYGAARSNAEQLDALNTFLRSAKK